MKLVSFHAEAGVLAGWVEGRHLYSVQGTQQWLARQGCCPLPHPLPVTMEQLVAVPPATLVENLRALCEAVALRDDYPVDAVLPISRARLAAPLPNPRSIRDFYAFEAHVKAARGRRGLDMIPQWYKFPAFYFTNPSAVYGPGETIYGPRESMMLDFELEVAAVIGGRCENVKAEHAERYIAGYMIMNDWSARDIQREEMQVGLGPAKGKDFATSLGPWLVTSDQLMGQRRGDRYDLMMTATVNGREVSRGNLADLHFSFGEMVERASRDCPLFPGEVIGSGTVGTGCLLETGALPWLRPGDVVALTVEGLGTLKNVVGDPERRAYAMQRGE